MNQISLLKLSTKDKMEQKMVNELFEAFDNVTRKSIFNILLEKFIELISDGVLLPGFTFPNENEMCKRLGVGRSTLRETYTALKAMGYITRTKAGTIVNNKSQILSSMSLNYLLKKSELQDIYEFRDMLETQCAEAACSKASVESIRKLGGIIEEMRIKAAEHDIEALAELDVRFHFEIASSLGNSLISNTLAAVTNEFERSATAGYFIAQSVIENSIAFHEQIFEAIKSHDAEMAKKRMRAHIHNIYEVLQKATLEDK